MEPSTTLKGRLFDLVDQLRSALAADAPAQWTARTVLIAADVRDVASRQAGVSVA
jgi:hypothetical protein